MYKITRPIAQEINFLIKLNRSRLTLLDVCYRAGMLTATELERLRGLAIRGNHELREAR